MTARSRSVDVSPKGISPTGMTQTKFTESEGGIDFGPLGQRLGYVMRRAQLAIFEDFIATCAVENIRPGQYSALTIIDCNPGLSQAEVAAVLGIKTPNFVAMVDELEARGLVRRTVLPVDRRRHALVLTPAGRRLVAALHTRAEAHEQRLIERVGRQTHQRMFAWLAAIAGLGQDASAKPAGKRKRGLRRRNAR